MRWLAVLVLLLIPAATVRASDAELPRDIKYAFSPPAPPDRTVEQARAMNAGCASCHTASDAATMHKSDAVALACVDCHGGNAEARLTDKSWKYDDPRYIAIRDTAHVMPRYPKSWGWKKLPDGSWKPTSANPRQSYTLLNKEAPEYIRFVNPSDYRVARESCGACHIEVIEAAERSIMASGAMLWGGAAYNNGIIPFKNYAFGEAYTRTGEPAKIVSPGEPEPGTVTPEQRARGALPVLYPLPTWQVVPPGDIFRVFERGGRNISTQFAEIGLPNLTGSIQRLDEPGRPDLKQSNRGPGTGLRVAIPVLNIHKTRLNDPFMWFMGTNDQPGDYRQSGCAACHVVYANDREPRHSSVWSRFGRDGETATVDPTIAGKHEPEDHDEHGAPPPAHGMSVYASHEKGLKERGHPIEHAFTRAIPTSQCMNCHMHQPNIFLNSYLGYTMWDYESDAPRMWPKTQHYPGAAFARSVLDRNPEAAVTRGSWADMDFLRNVYDLNDQNRDTQFADYHGHGWNFRAILKRDREGNLLDADGRMATYGTEGDHIVSPDDPQKWRKECKTYLDAPKPDQAKYDLCMTTAEGGREAKFAPIGINPGKSVHLMDIHAEKGLQCVDCHFTQDGHGNGLIYGEVANAVEIGCKDCHGTASAYPTLLTSGPAARPEGTNLSLIRNPDGQRRFEWMVDDKGQRVLMQRSVTDPKLEWRVHLVKDSVTEGHPDFNARAARAKLMGTTADGRYGWGPGIAPASLAHGDDKMACFTCHLSWTTSCGGCHLPIEANWKTSTHKYEGEETRNFATYNPQVARDDMFQLGRHMTTKPGEVGPDGKPRGIIAPVRSTSALILSSTNLNRERIYIQQPPISAIGFSSQAFAPHFPHTVRTAETKTCTDCHLSANDDNNAIMSQLMLLGTNFVNFVGMNAWTGLEGGFEAVRVTEWDEPQAVIGSYLQRYAYPDWWKAHVETNKRELIEWTRGKRFAANLSGETHATEQFRNVVQGTSDAVSCLQLRGEYMFVAQGKGGFEVYDVASIANKGFSNPIVSAPFSPLGHNTRVKTKNATCMALATDQPINPLRNTQEMRDLNQEQAFDPIYNYAVITDAEEGLILVDVNTLADGEFRNNFLKRAVTWNPDNVLAGARHITLAGHIAYVTAKSGLLVIDLADPLHPRLAATVPLTDARATAVQFRYLWVTDTEGMKLFDVTKLDAPVAVPDGNMALADAHRIYLARTYAYVAGGREGLVIINITKPAAPKRLDYTLKNAPAGYVPDVRDVVIGSTNASLFAYVADGRNGMKVLQLTSPESQRNFYGFSPVPQPELIAWVRTPSPALAMSKGLDRDRAVDETGGQIAVFGRVGSRPFTRSEMEKLFLTPRGVPYKVVDTPGRGDYVPLLAASR